MEAAEFCGRAYADAASCGRVYRYVRAEARDAGEIFSAHNAGGRS